LVKTSWRYCHSSSGFSFSTSSCNHRQTRWRDQISVWIIPVVVRFLCIQKCHWIISIDGKRNVLECKQSHTLWKY